MYGMYDKSMVSGTRYYVYCVLHIKPFFSLVLTSSSPSVYSVSADSSILQSDKTSVVTKLTTQQRYYVERQQAEQTILNVMYDMTPYESMENGAMQHGV